MKGKRLVRKSVPEKCSAEYPNSTIIAETTAIINPINSIETQNSLCLKVVGLDALFFLGDRPDLGVFCLGRLRALFFEALRFGLTMELFKNRTNRSFQG